MKTKLTIFNFKANIFSFSFFLILLFISLSNVAYGNNTIKTNSPPAPDDIGDYVWVDTDGDGVQDVGENGLEDVDVKLHLASDNSLVATVTTDAAGAYVFPNVAPGDYYLVFDANGADPLYTPTVPDAGGDDDLDSDVNGANGPLSTSTFTINAGDEILNMDAGFVLPSSLGNFVWHDADGDGQQTAGETGIGGVDVTLNNAGGVVMSTTTAADGSYQFDDIVPGTYHIHFDLASSGYDAFTTQDVGGDDTDSDPDPATGNTIDIVIESGDPLDENWDAGLYKFIPEIKGLAWHDKDGDGIQDGAAAPDFEDGIENVDVNLMDASDAVVSSTTTNAAGEYLFTTFTSGDGIKPGQYRVEFDKTSVGYDDFTKPDEGPDESLDSDAGYAGATADWNSTNWFTTLSESGETYDELSDAGLYRFISLGDYCWQDGNQDGIQDAGEYQLEGVEIHLYRVDDGADLITVVSDAAGLWGITNIPPDEYYLEYTVPSASFLATLKDAGPDDIDSDVNDLDVGGTGVTDNFFLRSDDVTPVEDKTLDAGFYVEPPENCDNSSITECEQADLYCDLWDLNEWCTRMPDGDSPGSQPDPLCPTGGTAHNISWWSFVAGSEEMELILHTSNCVVPGGFVGVQYGIYTDCSFTETIICEPNCQPPGDVPLTASGLTIGQTYYFFLDGCYGTACDYWIQIQSGGGSVNIVGPTDILCDDNFPDCTDICVGAEVTFTLDEIFNAGKYNWTISIDGGAATSYVTINPDTIFEFTVPGAYQLCAQGVNDCNEGDFFCIDFNVTQMPDEVLPPEDVCKNELDDGYVPDGWLGGDVVAGENIADNLETDLGCIFTQRITITELPIEYVSEYVVGCNGDIITVAGEEFDDDVVDEEVLLEGQSPDGCDKIVSVTAEFINVEGEILAECNGLNDGTIRVYFEDSDTAHIGTITYFWTVDGDLIEDSNSPSINVNENVEYEVTYEVTIEVTYKGITCTFHDDIIGLDILMDDYKTDVVEEHDWNTDICNNVDEYVSYTIVNANDELYPRWIYPDDLNKPVLFNDDSTKISINWFGHGGGVLCFFMFDEECGSSDTICETIYVSVGPTADFSIPDTICVGSDVITSYIGNATSSATYTWNYPDGTETSGTNGVGEGPHHISYDNPGLKNITLTVENNGCNSELVTESVMVVSPPAAPTPLCYPSATSIEFEWDDIEGAESTIVSHVGNGTGTLNGNNYVITGLNPNDVVQLIINVTTNGYCAGFSDTTECQALDCPVVDIAITPNDTSICLDGSNTPFTLDYTISPNTGGVVTWSGDGIIDPNTGLFDPDSAKIGSNTIVLTYDKGDCPYPSKAYINVYKKPTADFNIAVDTICISDEATITYSGTAPSGNASWNFDNGQIISGSGLTEHKVKWSSAGLKHISLEVEENGCNSDLATADVFVHDTLNDFIISCDPFTDTIGFYWNFDANVKGYKVLINGTEVQNSNKTNYTVKDLTPGDQVNITVIAIDKGICGDKVVNSQCFAVQCPDYKINLNTGSETICLDENTTPVTFIANVSGGDGTGTIEWTGHGVDKNTGVFDPKLAGPGVHEIFMRYQELCSADTTFYIEVIEQPRTELTTEKQIICISDEAIFHFNSKNPASTVYEWNLAGGNRTMINDSTFSMKWDKTGAFLVTLKTNNGICESEIKSAVVIVKPELIPPTIDCNATTNSIEITWNDDIDCSGSYNIYVNGEMVVNTTDTKYNLTDIEPNSEIDFKVEVVSNCECGNVSTSISCETEPCPNVTVSVKDLPEFICISDINASFDLTADIVGLNTGTVTWEGNGIDNNGKLNTSGLSIGQYEYTLKYNVSKCNYSSKDTLTVLALPSFNIAPSDPLCPTEANGELQISADASLEYYLDGVQSADGHFSDLAAGTYTVTAKDIHGCESSQEVTLTEPTPIDPNIAGSTDVYENNDGHFQLGNVDVNTLQSIVWSLQNGGTICSGIECTSVDLQLTEDDTLCVTIISKNNCEESTCLGLRYIEKVDIDIPNIFTPDDNGLNDVFFITSDKTVTQVKELNIFNRWGEKVFGQTNFPTNDEAYGWDGRFKGKKLNPGVYVYYVIFEMKNSKDLKLVGDVTIVR